MKMHLNTFVNSYNHFASLVKFYFELDCVPNHAMNRSRKSFMLSSDCCQLAEIKYL